MYTYFEKPRKAERSFSYYEVDPGGMHSLMIETNRSTFRHAPGNFWEHKYWGDDQKGRERFDSPEAKRKAFLKKLKELQKKDFKLVIGESLEEVQAHQARIQTDYRAVFSQRVEQLAQLPGVEIKEFVMGIPVREQVMDMAEGQLGMEFPQALKDLYFSMNGLYLGWTFQEGEQTHAFELDLNYFEALVWGQNWRRHMYKPPFEYAHVGNTWDRSLKNELPADQLEIFQKTMPIQYPHDSTFIGFFPEVEGKTFQCYELHRWEATPMKLDFQTYLDTLLLTMGVPFWWQYYYAGIGARDFAVHCLPVVQKLFPKNEFFK